MVECWLPYGKTEVYLSVDMNHLLGTVKPQDVEPETPLMQIILDALAEPAGSRSLDELVGTESTVAIAVEGTTTPQIASTALSVLVNELVTLIVPKSRITIIIGNGARGQSSKELLEAINSNPRLSDVRLIEHTLDSANLADLGKTHRGTPVKLNREYAEASLKIAVGETLVDSYTGFRGAHTAIVPGLCAQATVEAYRSLIFKGAVSPGVIELNPVKEDALQVVEMAGVDLALNLVTSHQGKLLSAHAGGVMESWGKAITDLAGSYEVAAEGGADIVVVSAGGSKFDFNLYNAGWALGSASKVVKKGGTIILIAECPEGLGAGGMSSLAHVDQLSELERRYVLGGEAVHMLRRVTKRNHVTLVSSLPRYLAEPLGLEVARTANEAYENAVRSRRGRRTLVIPHGCSTIPLVS